MNSYQNQSPPPHAVRGSRPVAKVFNPNTDGLDVVHLLLDLSTHTDVSNGDFFPPCSFFRISQDDGFITNSCSSRSDRSLVGFGFRRVASRYNI